MPADSFGGYDQSYQAPVYPGEWRPVSVKKKINPLAIIIPAAVLVIAAVAIVLFILLSNKTDYRKAEQNFFNNTFGTALSSADNAASRLKNQGESFKIKFETPSGSMDIPDFSAKIDTAPMGGNTYTEISFSMDGTDLDIQGWVDSAAETIHIYFPEISDIYAKFNLSDLTSQAYGASVSPDIDYDKYYDALERICGKVSDKYFELVGDPEIEKNQSFALEGKTYTADKCVITLDSKQLVELIKTLFEAIADDDELIEMITDASDGQVSASEIKSELNQVLNNMDEALDTIVKNDFAFEMTVYMKKNTIVGREIKVKVSGLSAIKLSFYDIPTDDGRVVAFKTSSDLLTLMNSMSSAYGDDAAILPMMAAGGYGYGSYDAVFALLDTTFILEDKSKGDVHSGTASFRMGSIFSANLEYNDLALTEELCQGSAELTVSDMPAFGVDLELSKDGEDKVIELDITNVCSITVTEGPSDLKYKELPDIPSSRLAEIDPNSSSYDNEALQQLSEDLSRAFGGYNY